ncbi:SDR family NAD(P)-dependent oxidoreductase [Aerococcaceae bacterium WGS1372]
MSEKLIWVTGGNSGIGQACVQRFLSKGYKVISIDRVHDKELINSNEFQVTLDLLQLEEIEDWAKKASLQYGIPDVLVNCAGTSRMDYLVDAKLEDWQFTFELNVYAVFELSKAFANLLIKTDKAGRIINIASQAGKNGYRAMSSYVASKHALIGLTKTAAIELAPHNILVNAVCPGIVETAMKHRERIEGGKLRGMTAEEVFEEDCSQVPLGRTAQADEVAGLVEFLTTEESSYMTGQAINITGGMTMH